MFERLVEKLCERLVRNRPYRVIPRPDGGPYLVRYYLFGGTRKADSISGGDTSTKLSALPKWMKFNVFLHLFVSGDVEQELHSHPWENSYSLILTGGYREERRIGNEVVVRTIKPGTINSIKSDDFHRVDLLKDKCWTLFFAGKTTQTWFFWDRKTKETIPWREQVYVRRPTQPTVEA